MIAISLLSHVYLVYRLFMGNLENIGHIVLETVGKLMTVATKIERVK